MTPLAGRTLIEIAFVGARPLTPAEENDLLEAIRGALPDRLAVNNCVGVAQNAAH